MHIRLNERQADLLKDLIRERTRNFDQEQFEGMGQSKLLREYEVVFVTLGGAMEMAQIWASRPSP